MVQCCWLRRLQLLRAVMTSVDEDTGMPLTSMSHAPRQWDLRRGIFAAGVDLSMERRMSRWSFSLMTRPAVWWSCELHLPRSKVSSKASQTGMERDKSVQMCPPCLSSFLHVYDSVGEEQYLRTDL